MQIHSSHAFLSPIQAGSLARHEPLTRAQAEEGGTSASAKAASAHRAPSPIAAGAERALSVQRLQLIGEGARAAIVQRSPAAASLQSAPAATVDAGGMTGPNGAGPPALESSGDTIEEGQNGPTLPTNGLNENPMPKQYELNVPGLMEAWGTNDPAYDLDGDGVVGVSDLLALLAAGGTMMSDKKPNDSLGGLLNDWGKGGSQYDYTGSGSVGVGDLLDFLSKGG